MESLDAATVLAYKLKKRSEDMLETLGSDIMISRTDKTSGVSHFKLSIECVMYSSVSH
jgi:hypothetical protein